jgi:hypothetical protein
LVFLVASFLLAFPPTIYSLNRNEYSNMTLYGINGKETITGNALSEGWPTGHWIDSSHQEEGNIRLSEQCVTIDNTESNVS